MSDRSQSTDTGKDCPYCGGVIYRVENESGNVTTAFHNCKMCGARWSDSWSLTSPGRHGHSVEPKLNRRPRPQSQMSFDWRSFSLSNLNIPSWGWILIVIVGAYFLIRTGVAGFIGSLASIFMVIILGYIVYMIVKDVRSRR